MPGAKKKLVLGCGEILWDLLPQGKQLGGAPVNVVCHAHALGADARPVTRIGRDPLGRETLARLRDMGLPTGAVQIDPAAPTGAARVDLSSGHPKFVFNKDCAWDRMRANARALALARRADAIVFGTLAQRSAVSRRAVRDLAAAAPRSALRLFDVNLRAPFYSAAVVQASLRLANAVKMNDQELPALAKMLGLRGSAESQLAALMRRGNLRLAALTRGSRGSLICLDGAWAESRGVKARVVDTVGAGDAFTAALLMGALRGWSVEEISRRANEVAAFVVSRAGATPRLPAKLSRRFRG